MLKVLYCVYDSLGLISHFSARKDSITNSDRASVTMENLQMAMLVWASRQKSDGVRTQIDDAGDRECHGRSAYRLLDSFGFLVTVVNTQN